MFDRLNYDVNKFFDSPFWRFKTGGGGGSKTTTTTQREPAVTGLSDELIAALKPFIGQGEELFPGPMVAPFTPEQQAALKAGSSFLPFLAPTGPGGYLFLVKLNRH